jgi:hypothetical protein
MFGPLTISGKKKNISTIFGVSSIGMFVTNGCDMPKNILLKSLFEIVGKLELKDKVPNRAMLNSISDYRRMQTISIDSFQKNLPGEWTLIELGGQKSNLQQAFKYVMKRTREIWLEHAPCNILYSDPDTLCVKPLLDLEKFKEFRIFTNGARLSRSQYHNCGVRWFPHTTQQCVWDFFDQALTTWHDDAKYHHEQDIYADAMWIQPNLDRTIQQNLVDQVGEYYKDFEYRCDQTIWFHTPEIEFTQSPPILHVHASRNPANRVAWMQEIWDKIQ